MGRCCAVNFCLSGRKVPNSNNILNLKKRSLFKVPKKTDLANRWSAAIGQELTSNNYICELHFHTTDIIKEDRLKLTDGKMYISERCRFRLKPDAIPELNLNQDSNNSSCDDNLPNINYVDRADNEVSINNQNDDSLFMHSVNNLENANSNENIDDLPRNYLLTKAPVDDFLLLNNVSVDGDVKMENVNNGGNDIDNPNNIPVLLVTKVVAPISESCNTEYLSVFDIYNALQTRPLPQNWSWTSDHEKSIILSYLDSTCWKLKCHMKIRNDLTVKVINAYTDVYIDVHEVISEVDTVWNLLSEVQNYHFCNGTGYDEERCSSTCRGIVLPNDYKKNMTQYRCVVCRQTRKNIQNRNDKKIDKDFQGLYNEKRINWI